VLRVLLVDDHEFFRHGTIVALKTMFAEEVDAVEADRGATAIALLQAGEEFDLVLLDLGLPDLSGPATARAVIAAAGATPVIILSGSEDPDDISQCISLGARGYILKSTPLVTLKHSISLILSGQTYLAVPSALARQVTNRPLPLTQRQIEVVRLLAGGQSNKQIANALRMPESTVKVHVRDIMHKLGVKNRTQAAISARNFELF
jgi:DNA-binding NarL/FixJ family response regulator